MQYAIKHANTQRSFDAACAAFEFVADIAVLVLKQSNSISFELRHNFLDRWFTLLLSLTIFNRGAAFFLWLASPSKDVYAQWYEGGTHGWNSSSRCCCFVQPCMYTTTHVHIHFLRHPTRRGIVVAGARVTRCIIFFGWITLNRVCALHVPCFIARGSILDGVITTMLVLPFMARLRFVHHVPLQIMAALTAVLMISGPAGTCAVFDQYAATDGATDGAATVCAHTASCLDWNHSRGFGALSGSSLGSCNAHRAYGPTWLVPLQDWVVLPWQVSMFAVDGPNTMRNACTGCVQRATADRQPCVLLPTQLEAAHNVVQRLLGWLLAVPISPSSPSQAQAACWSMCVFWVVVSSYVVGCVLYTLELQHRMVFVATQRPGVRLHPGDLELGSQVTMYQFVFFYFTVTLTWMTLSVLVV